MRVGRPKMGTPSTAICRPRWGPKTKVRRGCAVVFSNNIICLEIHILPGIGSSVSINMISVVAGTHALEPNLSCGPCPAAPFMRTIRSRGRDGRAPADHARSRALPARGCPLQLPAKVEQLRPHLKLPRSKIMHTGKPAFEEATDHGGYGVHGVEVHEPCPCERDHANSHELQRGPALRIACDAVFCLVVAVAVVFDGNSACGVVQVAPHRATSSCPSEVSGHLKRVVEP